jgi:hypothetical protein
MDIKDFEKHVTAIALSEGFSYYRVGVLEDVLETAKGQWDTSVRGPNHKVHVEVRNDAIEKASCSCPEKTQYCSHIIATLYTIRHGVYNAKNHGIEVPPKAKPEKPARENFVELVGKVPEKDIRKFIIAYGERDKVFRNVFHAQFIEHSALHERQHYRLIVERSIKTLTNTEYRYKDIRKAVQPVEVLLGQAENAIAAENYEQALAICLATIEALQDFVSVFSDSRGGTGDCMEIAFRLLEAMGKAELPAETREKFFEDVLAEASREIYHRDWHMDHWKTIMTATANTKEMKQKLETWIKNYFRSY